MWNQFVSWSGIVVSPGPISRVEKTRIVAWVLPLMVRRHVVKPVTKVLQQRLPMWCLMVRLRRHDGYWWEIPSDAVGVHASRRLGGRSWIEGDLIRIVGGKCIAYGWIEAGKLESEAL